jgi:hypothetical protein
MRHALLNGALCCDDLKSSVSFVCVMVDMKLSCPISAGTSMTTLILSMKGTGPWVVV